MELSEIINISGMCNSGHQPVEEKRFYGENWLFEQVAHKVCFYDDLMVVFNENEELVKDILTLAMFLYLTAYSYNRVPNWQRIERTLSSNPLTAICITRFTQSITETERMEFMRLRGKRLTKKLLWAVDSTSCCNYGGSLADVRNGKTRKAFPCPVRQKWLYILLANICLCITEPS